MPINCWQTMQFPSFFPFKVLFPHPALFLALGIRRYLVWIGDLVGHFVPLRWLPALNREAL